MAYTLTAGYAAIFHLGGIELQLTHVVLKLAIVPILVALGFFLVPELAHACKCALPASPEEAFNNSVVVFSGEATSIRGVTPEGIVSDAPDTLALLVSFRVGTVWKGEAYQTMLVTTQRWEVSCGVGFIVGREYLVYAYANTGLSPEVPLRSDRCNGTQEVHDAVEDMEWLGEGTAPGDGTVAPLPAQEQPTSGMCGASPAGSSSVDTWPLGLAAMVVSLGFLAVRRRPRK